MSKLNGKVILVTGGAQGLGKEVCRTLAASGAQVIIGDIQEEKGSEAVSEIKGSGGSAVFRKLDLTDEHSVEEVFTSIKNEYGRIDGVINNAGIDFTKPLLELTVSEWDAAMAVNLRGPFLTSKYALSVMSEQKNGYIVNIISTAALRAWTEASVYHASKWGLRGFSQALFTEARRFNIKVTALIAGGMRTPFLLDRFPDLDLSKLQDPANVAEKVKYLLEDDTDTVIPEIMVIPQQETSWP